MTTVRSGNSPAGRSNQPSDRIVAEAAWMYYVKGLNQDRIAKALSLSRPTVISYLRLAKERRLVDIRIAPEHYRLNALSDVLTEKFSLKSAHVVPEEALTEKELLHAVCEVAAHLLPTLLKPGDQLGVSWGTTIALVAELMPNWPIENIIVRQLIGSMANPLLNTSESCTMEISRRLSAYCINLNAPAVCSTPELAQALRQEPIIHEQLADLSLCKKAIYSLSPCTPATQVVHLKVVSRKDIASYKKKGAVGMIAGRFIDAHGEPVLGEFDDRLLGADHEVLRAMEGQLVASGLSKLHATLAALRGSYVDHIVVDTSLAEGVIEAAGAET